ncbi:DUF1285 domain-containing protein [Candidatus Sororendozoicomonas aggregata]|uniref:DUF1285 domain-containing protein n=1 Tax=Candidatus Sororendozoicomonas aggregata TaxID=3073239 RepID=UPI002ED26ED8
MEALKPHVNSSTLPPVHQWNPPFCGDIDMRILRDGQWLYMGTSIKRPAMVKLFSSVLRRDDDDCYYLVTPVEKVRIQVDDVPFVVVSMTSTHEGLVFITHTDDLVLLSEDHPLWVTENDRGEPLPYIRVRDRLNALINRNVFYQLVERAEINKTSQGDVLTITSAGQTFTIGEV